MMYRTYRHIHEMDAIRRSDTARTMREVGWLGDISEDDDAPTGAAIVWAAGCLIVAVVALLVLL